MTRYGKSWSFYFGFVIILLMTTIVGAKNSEGIVLASDKRASKGFFIGSKIVQKILRIDDNLAIAIAGQLSDAEYLIKVVKSQKRLLELQRDYPLTINESAKLISNIAYNGLKSYQPYLVELIVAGTDGLGNHIFVADMSGALTDESIAASGSGAPIAYGVLESLYKVDLNTDDLIELCKKAVLAAMERDPGSGNGLDVVTILNKNMSVQLRG